MIEASGIAASGGRRSLAVQWARELAEAHVGLGDDERVDLLRDLEELKSAAAAAQARITADFDASQREAQRGAGVPAHRHGEGIASQVALARRESPVRGAQHLGLAKALVHEMPGSLRALAAGRISEWRATLLVRETACLSREDRTAVDAAMTADLSALEGMGDRALVREARRLAYRFDPESVVSRRRSAVTDRPVTRGPAPYQMTYLTALLPVAQGVATYAALTREAARLRSEGDSRGRGQAMADTLVSRVTGLQEPGAVPVTVNLVMTDRTLLTGDDEPAELEGYGVVPADWARGLALEADAARWVRRLYAAPATGELVALDSRSRLAPRGLADFVRLRDRSCRTPWCDAPVRHVDHVVPHSCQGPTAAPNLDGLCERCNHAKQAVGWRARPRPGSRHTVEMTTPTGHTYRSTAPPLPGEATPRRSRLEATFADVVLVA